MAIKPEAGMTMCSTWDVTDHKGEQITVGFVARSLPESQDDDGRAVDLPRDELAQPAGRAGRPGAITWRNGSSTASPNRACTGRWSTRGTGRC